MQRNVLSNVSSDKWIPISNRYMMLLQMSSLERAKILPPLSTSGCWLIPVAFLIIFCTNSHSRNAWTAISFIKNRQNQRFLIIDLDLNSYSMYPISADFFPNSYINVHYLLDGRKSESHISLNTQRPPSTAHDQ